MGEGVFRHPPKGSRDRWEVAKANQGAPVYPRPIAFLRAAGADSGVLGGVVDRIRIATSSDPTRVPRTDHPLITFQDIWHRRAAATDRAVGHQQALVAVSALWRADAPRRTIDRPSAVSLGAARRDPQRQLVTAAACRPPPSVALARAITGGLSAPRSPCRCTSIRHAAATS